MIKSFARLILAIIFSLNFACHSTNNTSNILQDELIARINNNSAPTILDVRTPEEYNKGHIPGAINLPVDKIEKKVKQLNLKPSDEIVVYCESGFRAKKAEEILLSQDYFEIRHLVGDMGLWRKEKLPCEGC